MSEYENREDGQAESGAVVPLDEVIRVLDEMRRDKVRVSVKPQDRSLRENTISEVLSEAMGRVRDLSAPDTSTATKDAARE